MPSVAQDCHHSTINDDCDCDCGNDIRPTSTAAYRLGVLPAATVTEDFIARNLGISTDELVNLICRAKVAKDAMVATVGPEDVLERSSAGWRMVDGARAGAGAVNWVSRVGRELVDDGLFSFRELDRIEVDPYAGEQVDIVWSAARMQDTDIHTGGVNLKRTGGGDWVYSCFIPIVIRMLDIGDGPSPGLGRKLRYQGSGKARPLLMYQEVKFGLRTVSASKQAIWERALAARTRVQVAKLLCGTGNVDGGSYELEQRLLQRIKTEQTRAMDAEEGLTRRLAREKARSAAVRVAVEQQFKEVHIRIDEDRVVTKAHLEAIQEESKARSTAACFEFQTEKTAVEQRIASIQEQMDVERLTSAAARLMVDERFVTVETRFANMAKQATRQTSNIDAGVRAVTLEAGKLQETRHIFAAQIERLMSVCQPVVSVPPVVQTAIRATPSPAPRLFLCIRNSSQDRDPESEQFDLFKRIFIEGESTFRVSHQVLSALHIPFLISLMGYSRGRKSHTMLATDGVLAALIGKLPSPLNITVTEVSETVRPMCDLVYPTDSVADILEMMQARRTTSATPANATLSRTHIVVLFENIAAGVPYGCLVDVCGAEESGHKAEGSSKARNTAIAQENVLFRLMLMELAADGKKGFTTRSQVTVVKHASALNMAVGGFLKHVLGEPEIRVLACMDGGKMEQLARVVSVLPMV